MENNKNFIHPEFWRYMGRILPADELDTYRKSILTEPATGIRLHLNKGRHDFQDKTSVAVPWNLAGLLLNERPEFSPDPYFHSGAYYVQDPSAMFLHHLLNEISGKLPDIPLIGDICAAPGGKSTIILDFLKNRGLLVSNEIVPKRNAVLRDNLIKWGYLNVINSRKETEIIKHAGAVFDLLLVDAPCSGEGMFRKSAAARQAWTPELVQKNADRQLKILEDCLGALKPGGHLIYCNCTMNMTENEGVVIALSQKYKLQALSVSIPETWNIHVSEKNGFSFYRFFSHRIAGEGMTYCIFQKTESKSEAVNYTGKPGLKKPDRKQATELQKFLNPDLLTRGQFFINQKGELFYLPDEVSEIAMLFMEKIQAAPLPLGEFRKDLFIPDHYIVMSGSYNQQIPLLDLDKNQALLFLRKTPFKLNTTIKGWAIAGYQGQAIGWIKIHPKGGKFTNYYPNSLRLLNY